MSAAAAISRLRRAAELLDQLGDPDAREVARRLLDYTTGAHRGTVGEALGVEGLPGPDWRQAEAHDHRRLLLLDLWRWYGNLTGLPARPRAELLELEAATFAEQRWPALAGLSDAELLQLDRPARDFAQLHRVAADIPARPHPAWPLSWRRILSVVQ